MTFSTVDILGVRVDCVHLQTLLAAVFDWSAGPSPRTVAYVNAHCLNIAAGDQLYREILNQADLVYADGMSVVWSSRLFGGCRLEKLAGGDWIFEFCRLAEAQGLGIFILAGKPGVAQQAQISLLKSYPALKIVGICDGFLSGQTDAEVLDLINQAQPQVLFVGMGTPRQEKWIAQHRPQITAPVCWAVGAMFDYVAGKEPRAPAWMSAAGLEWLFRLCVDPRGKWRRYLIGNPLFVYRILRQRLTGRV